MSDTLEVRVPDIGDFAEVPVIEILVKPGDAVRANDSLVVLESDKASMEVPSPAAGTIKELHVKVGDKVSQGAVILSIASSDAAPEPTKTQPAQPESKPAPPDVQPVEKPAPAEASITPPAVPAPRATAIVELTVPDVGDFKDIPVIEVLVKVGDTIRANDSLAVLESDKASMEIPASAGGVVQELRVKPGDKVSQGTVIATLETAAAPPAAPPPAQPQSQPATQPQSQPEAQPQTQTRPAAPTPMPASSNGAVHASPSIRRFARELGVDLARLRGSGPNGRVTRDDVQNFVKSALRGDSSGTASGFTVAAWPKVDFAKFGPIERTALTRIQKISGPALHRNWVMIPHVTHNDDADVTDLEAFRSELNAQHAADRTKVTMLAFLVKAAVAALKQYPHFNASLDGDALVLKHYYNIGFAADTPDGLLVPVIKDADQKGVIDIAIETAELAAKARDGKLASSDMQGGTFTISSLGSIGGTYFTPIINAPEVAILGACRAAMKPVWDGKAFAPRLIQPLSLSYDHRVIDGASAARFAVCIVRILADIRRAIL